MLSLLPISRIKRQTFHPPQTRSPYAMSQSMNQLRWHVYTNGSGFLVSLYNSMDHLFITFFLLNQLPTNIS